METAIEARRRVRKESRSGERTRELERENTKLLKECGIFYGVISGIEDSMGTSALEPWREQLMEAGYEL